jgi:uncharacterized protein YpmS
MDDSPSDRISLVVTARGKVVKNKNRSWKNSCEIFLTILIQIVPAIITMIAILIWATHSLQTPIKKDSSNSSVATNATNRE